MGISRISKITARELGLLSDSFSTNVHTGPISRVIANVEAKQKAGKTHFCLTAPDPIVFFNFDQGLEGVVEPFQKKGKTIVIAGVKRKSDADNIYPSYHFARPVPLPKENRKSEKYLERVKAAAYPMWEKFISDYDEFLHSKARTGIIDTGGAAFALAKFAFMGMDKYTQKDDPYGQKSGDMKAIFQGLITDGYNYNKNVLWVHRVKETWVDNRPSGQFETDGYKQLPYEVQMTVRLRKKMVKGETTRIAEIRDCRVNDKANGDTFEGRACNFAMVMSSVFGTEIEDWE